MIRVERLSKRYGTVKAVDRVSFEVGRGEIVGLLGPNGAGKTTTMRMLTTFLAPTSGKASVAGHDVLDDPIEVRRRVGYLPENVPLYPEMRVREYLSFRARLKDVPRTRRRPAIDAVVERCALEEVEDRVLGHLSKGFRQRVGLAEAMVHDPDILVLDEPTAGLDPIQIREVRVLIRELGDRHTILLSTHIMSEVEAVCGRVIIIARGRIAEDQPLERLRAGSTVVVEARGPVGPIRSAIEGLPGVGRVEVAETDGEFAGFEVQAAEGADPREALGQRLYQGGWPLRRLDLRQVSLEDRFVQAVTRAELADGEAETAADAPIKADVTEAV
jgi:ABC-2 type transport system ATP-binding protein